MKKKGCNIYTETKREANMIEKICTYIVNQMRKRMSDIDDEKAEIITYGVELIIGEIPKIFLLFVLSFILGIGWYTVLTYVALIPYRASSGGFHLKTHIGCIIGSSVFYYGIVYLSKFITLDIFKKYMLIGLALVFGIIMVSLYAPADTENIPIISKKERKRKKILSYITLVLTLAVSIFIKDNVISNILIFGVIIQSFMISRLAYLLTNNKYGYKVYQQKENIA